MKDFVSEIKKINTDGLIYTFSEISIRMFKDNQCIKKVEIPVIRYGRNQKLIVQLSAWDIPNIAFLSVKESNDYLNILVRVYRCSGGTDTANPAAGNRCSATGIRHLIDCLLPASLLA